MNICLKMLKYVIIFSRHHDDELDLVKLEIYSSELSMTKNSDRDSDYIPTKCATE